jgi:hypothetical protein
VPFTEVNSWDGGTLRREKEEEKGDGEGSVNKDGI